MGPVVTMVLQVAGGIAGSIGLLLAAGYGWERVAEARQAGPPPAPGRMVDVGGRRLHLRCKGDAPGPTIMIEQGAGSASYYWWAMQDTLAKSTRVCTYDRAGYGWSDPAPAGRSIKDRADELHRMLRAARVPGPYVLVGHSYGGPIIALFARDHPEDVAGLVFADTPDMENLLGPGYQAVTRKMHMPGVKVLRFLTRFGIMRAWAGVFPNRTLTSGLPPEARAAAAATRRTAASDAAIDDLRSLWTVPAADRVPLAAGALGQLPVAVISHGLKFRGPFAALEEGFEASQARLAALSANSLHVTLPQAGHIVQVDAPEAVADIIRRTHAAARDGTRLNGRPKAA